jgi:hypothetical protein
VTYRRPAVARGPEATPTSRKKGLVVGSGGDPAVMHPTTTTL